MANGGNGDDVEIVVIGDVYWDTVVVPFPAGKSDSEHLQPAYARIVRPGGAWLLQSMIETAPGPKVKIHGYGEKNSEGEFAPLVSGIDQEQCRRALTVLKLFSKDDKDKKSELYRMDPKQSFGWGALPLAARRTFPTAKTYVSKFTRSSATSSGENSIPLQKNDPLQKNELLWLTRPEASTFAS